ncbi:hypothetical protein ACJDU8_18710 [Clostridium sp. WILCCON 0269]|uniref:Uncharacterized protein n=1 Tax=Candidatus Clostridium eludens TaxID=3381663 RepID=A0ABW8SNV0_9CLOT
MIEQHYYTRERRGVFSKTPGYDTVAKSEGLENEFITNTLSNLCFYEAPASLVGEENILKYPPALFYVDTEDNKMVIGQSAFAGKDYTGGRNRYFTHSYIIPEEEKYKYIENPEKIIYSAGFVRDYDIEKGTTIPEISEIKLSRDDDYFNSIEDMFSAANIDREIFADLIKACFQSVKYHKKIYIVLDCEYSDMNSTAKGILKYLYRALPFEVRRNLGFITYMKEPKIKNLINIIFLGRGSIRRLSTEIKSGCVFDLSKGDFYLEDIDQKKHEFIDFVMNNIENTEKLKNFFYRADSVLLEDRLDIYKYDGLFKDSPHEKSEEKKCIDNEKSPQEISTEPLADESKDSTIFRIIYKKILKFLKK